MKIHFTSVMVNDQQHALGFYTTKLGFVVRHDVPAGEYRWLTVVSPEAPDGPELLLEPMGFAPAKTYQQELYGAGIPAVSFAVENIDREYERLTAAGVVFRQPPAAYGPVKTAVLDDTCGNLVQLMQR